MSAPLRSRRLSEAYYRMVGKYALPLLDRSGLTANHITLAGTFTAALVPLGFWVHPLMGLVLIVVSGVADSLDGQLARLRHQASPFGAFLDSSLDRISDFFYLSGFWVLLWSRPGRWGATALILCAHLITYLISYVKARAEGLGISCCAGFMERGLRVLFFILWSLALIFFPLESGKVLWIGLLLYFGLTLSTLIQRMLDIRRQMET